MSLTGIDVSTYQNIKDGQSGRNTGMSVSSDHSRGPTEKISAWRGLNNGGMRSLYPSTSSIRSKESLFRSNTDLMSSIRAKDPSLERLVSSRLYRLELAKDEAETKLSEWVKVATELQEIIQEQQNQIENLRRRQNILQPPDSTSLGDDAVSKSVSEMLMARRPTSGKSFIDGNGNRGSQVSHLKELVKSVRLELNKSDSSKAIEQQQRTSDAGRLQSEIGALRRQLASLQQCQRSDLEEKQEELLHLQRQFEEAQKKEEEMRYQLKKKDTENQELSADVVQLQKDLEKIQLSKGKAEHDLDLLRNNLIELQQELETQSTSIKKLKQEKDDALTIANDAAIELQKLQAQLEGSLKFQNSMKNAAERSGAEIADLESKIRSLETSLSVERTRRANAEASINDLNIQLASAQQEAKYRAKNSKKVTAEMNNRIESLEEELQKSRSAEVDARNEVEKLLLETESLRSTNRAFKGTLDEIRSKLRATIVERDDALRQAALVELNSEEKASELIATLKDDYEKEIKALKEVISRITASAQEKGSEVIALRKQLDDMGCQLESKATEAEADSANYAAAIEKLKKEWKPVDLQIHVEDLSNNLEKELAAERQGHIAAVKALEEAHEDEINRLKQKLNENMERMKSIEPELEKLSRLHAVETELLNAQSQAANLNAVVEKLRKKHAEKKEELESEKARSENAEKLVQEYIKRAENAEKAAEDARAELLDAQDEIEALLKAKIQDLSRAPSESGEGDHEVRGKHAATGSSVASSPNHNRKNDNMRNFSRSDALAKAVQALKADLQSNPNSSNSSSSKGICNSSLEDFSESSLNSIDYQMKYDSIDVMDVHSQHSGNIHQKEENYWRPLREKYQIIEAGVENNSENLPNNADGMDAMQALEDNLQIVEDAILMPPPPRRSPLKKLTSMFRGKKGSSPERIAGKSRLAEIPVGSAKQGLPAEKAWNGESGATGKDLPVLEDEVKQDVMMAKIGMQNKRRQLQFDEI